MNKQERKEEIERKKRKLADLKEQRFQRSSKIATNKENYLKNERKELDILIDKLVGNHDLLNIPIDQPVVDQIIEKPTLSLSEDYSIFELIPKEKVLYSKEVQTATTDVFFNENHQVIVPQKDGAILSGLESFTKLKDDFGDNKSDVGSIKEERASEVQMKELSDEEKKIVLSSEKFQFFFDSTTKLVERALNEPYDFMIDYSTPENLTKSESQVGNLKLSNTFYDEKWSKNRTVTSLHWSPKHQELMLSSYNKNPHSQNDPDGLVLVWNTHLESRPEFIFQSQSDVMTAKFSEFHSNYIIGGTYSGQILLWDTRAKRLPVLKSPLTGGHTNPVYSFQMAGTANAFSVVSASNDGVVCSWQMDMLAKPTEVLELIDFSNKSEEVVSVTCFDFGVDETTQFLCGTEQGQIFQVNRYDRAGSKAGINSTEPQPSHTNTNEHQNHHHHNGMITSLSMHPRNPNQNADFSDLYLTTSIDWQVKLWQQKKPTTSENNSGSGHSTVLHAFDESGDAVFDARWSPTQASVFAAVNASGSLDLYDLNKEAEIPLVTVRNVGGRGKGLNKVGFSSDGLKVAAGSGDGYVYVYELGEFGVVSAMDSIDFSRTLQDFAE